MIEKKSPQCVFEAEPANLPLALEFHEQEGRIHGFPYGHLLNYLLERNPDAESQPNAPADRFSLWFSTHDVVLLGWRLAGIAALLRHGRLAAIHAADARFYGLSAKEPFVSAIIVRAAQKEAP